MFPSFYHQLIAFVLSLPRLLVLYRSDNRVDRASTSKAVESGSTTSKSFKIDTHSFPNWRSTLKEQGGKHAGKFTCRVIGKGT